MPSQLLTPVLVSVPTTEAELVSLPASFDYAVDVQLTNTTASAITARVGIAANGTPTYGTDAAYAVYDKTIPANDSLIVARGLALPGGLRIRGRAGLAGLQCIITAAKQAQ